MNQSCNCGAVNSFGDWGPVLAAILALLGVWWSIRRQDRRHRYESLRADLSTRYAALRQAHSEFFARSLEYLALVHTKAGIMNDAAHIDSEEGTSIGLRRPDISDRWTTASALHRQCYAALALAYAQVRLLDQDSGRCARVSGLFHEVSSQRHHQLIVDSFIQAPLNADLNKFVQDTSMALLREQSSAEAELTDKYLG